MQTLCLKCKKLQRVLIQKFSKQKIVNQSYHQNVLCVVVKKQDLWKNKKQKECQVV